MYNQRKYIESIYGAHGESGNRQQTYRSWEMQDAFIMRSSTTTSKKVGIDEYRDSRNFSIILDIPDIQSLVLHNKDRYLLHMRPFFIPYNV